MISQSHQTTTVGWMTLMNQSDINAVLARAQALVQGGSEQAARQVVSNLIHVLQQEKLNKGNK